MKHVSWMPVKKGKIYLRPMKAKGAAGAVPNDSDHNGTVSHTTGGGQGRKEGRKCSYYNLHCHFNKLFLIHGIRF